MITNNSLLKNPSKKNILVFTIAVLLGLALILVASTDLFTKNPFKMKYLLFHMMSVFNIFCLAKMWKSYLKNNPNS